MNPRTNVKRWVSFSGRLSRKAYWAYIALVIAGTLVVATVSGLLIDRFGDWAITPFLLYAAGAGVVAVATSARRLHDLGRTGWWVLVLFVPYLGVFGLVPLLLLRGEVGTNVYGDDPILSAMTPEEAAKWQTLAAKREAAVAAQRQHNLVQRTAAEAAKRVAEARESVEQANVRLEELQSGCGAVLSTAGAATLYEFWLTVPGYSGPVAGASARVTQYGDVHSVSDVKGKTKGGLGGAVVGGALFGPAGAIVGGTIRRKTTVETTVRQVDTREYELEVTGPGYAYSVRSSDGAGFRRFRDLLNARGTSRQDVRALQESQRALVHSVRDEFERASSALASAQSAEAQSALAANEAWSGCLSGDSSFWEKARLRVLRARTRRLPADAAPGEVGLPAAQGSLSPASPDPVDQAGQVDASRRVVS